jgi:hypothetical protein
MIRNECAVKSPEAGMGPKQRDNGSALLIRIAAGGRGGDRRNGNLSPDKETSGNKRRPIGDS